MGWNDEEVKNTKKGMSTSSKVLIAMMTCLILIIILIIMLLMNMKSESFKIYLDGLAVNNTNQTQLLTTIDGKEYANIEEFSGLVGYEYHKGEYKSSTIDENKCYVEGENETATFYLNDSTIYKLPLNKLDEKYNEFTLENPVMLVNGKMYAPLDAIAKAFNVFLQNEDNSLQIYTLDYLVSAYDTNVIEWGYTSIKEQSFENQKAILYDCIIVKKEAGLYKIINTNNTKEIVLDRYKEINFSENTQEFFVKDSADKFGIINLDGTIKLQPVYDSIAVLDKESNLYIVEQLKKYGVVSGDGKSIIYPEYDSIGLKNNISDNKYLILDELIPVYKDKKWGAFNKSGNLILNVEFDELGYSSTSIEINGIKEVVEPVLAIKRAKGIVVKKADKYGLYDTNGRELIKVMVDGIYIINGIEDEDSKYYMLYNDEELNVIERLIKGGKIEAEPNKEEIEDTTNNNQIVTDNTINNIDTENNTIGNEVENITNTNN